MARSSYPLLALLLAIGPPTVVSKSDWDYKQFGGSGPSSWPGICQTGIRQSPIDIVVRHASPVLFDKFHFRNYNHLLNTNNVTLHNNGHSVKMEVAGLWERSTPTVKEGGLESVYVLDHIHFHAASEHTFNGRRYPLEAHLVHYDHQSSSVSDALEKRDGLAVLGVLFHLSDKPNKNLQALSDALKRLNGLEGGRVQLKEDGEPMSLSTFLPPETTKFFRYYGSLTTPGCHESVVWTVFEKSIPISKEQLSLFRMPDSNYRPAQGINRRFILHNDADAWTKREYSSSAPSALLSLVPLSPILASLLLLRSTVYH